MTGPTPEEVARASGLDVRPGVAPAVLASLPPLVPLVGAPMTLTTAYEVHPSRWELHGPAGPVGLLVPQDHPAMQALCADNAWTITTRRRGRLSWMGVADELSTGEAVAAYYPALRPGGAIALRDTHYRLTAPALRSGWRLRDEDRRPIAVFHADRTGRIDLREDSARVGGHLPLVLLLALWATLVTPAGESGGGGAGP